MHPSMPSFQLQTKRQPVLARVLGGQAESSRPSNKTNLYRRIGGDEGSGEGGRFGSFGGLGRFTGRYLFPGRPWE